MEKQICFLCNTTCETFNRQYTETICHSCIGCKNLTRIEGAIGNKRRLKKIESTTHPQIELGTQNTNIKKVKCVHRRKKSVPEKLIRKELHGLEYYLDDLTLTDGNDLSDEENCQRSSNLMHRGREHRSPSNKTSKLHVVIPLPFPNNEISQGSAPQMMESPALKQKISAILISEHMALTALEALSIRSRETAADISYMHSSTITQSDNRQMIHQYLKRPNSNPPASTSKKILLSTSSAMSTMDEITISD